MNDQPNDSGPGTPSRESGAESPHPARPTPASSVLRALQRRTTARLGVNLDESDDAGSHSRIVGNRYQILGEIARGGMGVVYRGRDADLGRDVAMKVLHEAFESSAEVIERFVEEAQIGGQLQHPGIVPVYELGLQESGQPFFAMKLIKGETLAAQLAAREDNTSDRRRFLGCFEQVCQTMAYAHARRVIHRDLKPANVMVGAFGEVQVVDWGFAKVLTREAIERHSAMSSIESARSVIETVRSSSDSGSQSVAGSVLGTPAYMPPEQALGDVESLDPRSDVFSLGAILCEVMTGEPPYLEKDGPLVEQAARGRLDSAYERIRASGWDDALVDLCIDCLSRAPSARPATARAVADRVGRYLTSVEERAHEAELRAANARLKQRTTVIAAVAAVLVLVLGGSGWFILDQQSQERRQDALREATAAQTEASDALASARTAGLDMALWNTAGIRAQQLETLATSEDLDESTRQGIADLRRRILDEQSAASLELARRQRDSSMATALVDLLVPTDEDVRRADWEQKDLRRLDDGYTAAFARYVAPRAFFADSVDSILESLRYGDITSEIATALDHWGLVRDSIEPAEGLELPSASGTARLRTLAAQLDPDNVWRSSLRRLLPDAPTEGLRLKQLINQEGFDELSAAESRVFASALWLADEESSALHVLELGRERNPDDFGLCFQLALYQEAQQEPAWDQSAATMRIANALRPDHAEALHRQGMALERLGRISEAKRLFDRLLDADPDNSHWLGHVADTLYSLDEREEAERLYRRAVELKPDDSRALTNLARVLVETDRHEEAEDLSLRALEIDPENPGAHHNLAVVLRSRGEIERAIEEANLALEFQDPSTTPKLSYYELGVCYLHLLEFERAIENFELALGADPTFGEAHAGIGLVHGRSGRFEESLASYRRAVELLPDDPRSKLNLAVMLVQSGAADEASPLLDEILAADPDNPKALSTLGSLVIREGDRRRGRELLERCIEIDPDFGAAYYNLAGLEMMAFRRAEALELYRKAADAFLVERNDVEGGPAWRARSLAQVGLLLAAEGQTYESDAAFREAIETNPREVELRIAHAQSKSMQGRDDEAIAIFEEVVAETPHPIGFNRLGAAYMRQDRVFEGAACFERAAKLKEEAPPYSNLGDVYQIRGWYQRSLDAYTRAKELFEQEDTPFNRSWGSRAAKRIAEIEELLQQAAEIVEGIESPESADELHASIFVAIRDRKLDRLIEITATALTEAPDQLSDGAWGCHDPAFALLDHVADTDLGAERRLELIDLARRWIAREVETWTSWIDDDTKLAREAEARLRDMAPRLEVHTASYAPDEKELWEDMVVRVRAYASGRN